MTVSPLSSLLSPSGGANGSSFQARRGLHGLLAECYLFSNSYFLFLLSSWEIKNLRFHVCCFIYGIMVSDTT